MMNPTNIDPQWDGVLLAEFASPPTVRGIKQFVTKHFTFLTKVKEVINPQKILQVLESDFVENSSNSSRNKPFLVEELISHNPREWNIKERDGHYKMTLPLQSDCHSLPFNCQLAVKRWNQLLARFRKNPKFLENYQALMTEIIELCAEKTNKTNKPRCTKLCASHWGVSPPGKRSNWSGVWLFGSVWRSVLKQPLVAGPWPDEHSPGNSVQI